MVRLLIRHRADVHACDEEVAMRIKVKPDRCQGHNRCFALAPELFDVDDYGMARALNNGEVPKDLEEKAHLAINNCPEFAVIILKK